MNKNKRRSERIQRRVPASLTESQIAAALDASDEENGDMNEAGGRDGNEQSNGAGKKDPGEGKDQAEGTDQTVEGRDSSEGPDQTGDQPRWEDFKLVAIMDNLSEPGKTIQVEVENQNRDQQENPASKTSTVKPSFLLKPFSTAQESRQPPAKSISAPGQFAPKPVISVPESVEQVDQFLQSPERPLSPPLFELPLSASDDESESEQPNKKSRMSFAGRKRDKVWSQFTSIESTFGVQSKCEYCHKVVSAKAVRMKGHLENCVSFNCTIEDRQATQTLTPVAKPKTTKPSPARGSHYKNWADTITGEEQNKIEKQLGRYIFSSNTAFRQVENPELAKLFQITRPAFKIPDRRKISTQILDGVYDETCKQVKDELDQKFVSVLQDGWSSVQNAPVVAHSLTNMAKHFFLDATNTGTNTKDAKYCLELLEQAIKMSEEQFGCIVAGVVTDNCTSMTAMRTLFSEKYPEMVTYGCTAHLLNLLGQALSPDELLDEIKKVQTHFRNHHYESSRLLELGGHRPVLAATTRWDSQMGSLKSYTKNYLKYMEIAMDKKANLPAQSKVYKTIFNNEIYVSATEVMSALNPVHVAIKMMQSEKASIADAVHMWMGLEIELYQNPRFAGFFEKWRPLVYSEAALAAYCIHPKYRGANLKVADLNKGHNYLNKRNHTFCTVAVKLAVNPSSFIPKSFLSEDTVAGLQPWEWWQAIGNLGCVSSDFTTLAKRLMSVAASSSGLERCFSVLGGILTKRRNRLGIDKAQKLCSVYMNLNATDYDSDGD